MSFAVAALSLAGIGLAGIGGVALPTGVALASSSPTITVQDEGSHDGAGVDTDGTQGDFHTATTGSVSGPIMDAVPQYKAG